MTKGTPSMGKSSKKNIHIRCRRCGNVSFHKRKGYCASCGFGKSKKFRSYNWVNKTKSRN